MIGSFGDGLNIVIVLNFLLLDEYLLQDIPLLLGCVGIGEEIEQNHIVKLQPFRFIDGEAKCVLQNLGDVFFAALILD